MTGSFSDTLIHSNLVFNHNFIFCFTKIVQFRCSVRSFTLRFSISTRSFKTLTTKALFTRPNVKISVVAFSIYAYLFWNEQNNNFSLAHSHSLSLHLFWGYCCCPTHAHTNYKRLCASEMLFICAENYTHKHIHIYIYTKSEEVFYRLK